MTETNELTLLDPYAYAEGCPHARLAELREAGTTSWQPGTFDPSTSQPEILGAWFVHRYEEVKAVLRDPATFSSQRRTALLVDPDPDRVKAMSNMLINMDPPKHSQYRRLVAAIFTPRRVEALRPRVEEIAKGVIDRIAPNGTADGINDIAAQLPMRVIAELLGVPERSEQIFDISNRMVGAVGGGPDTRLEQSLEAALEIHLLGQEIAPREAGLRRRHGDVGLRQRHPRGRRGRSAGRHRRGGRLVPDADVGRRERDGAHRHRAGHPHPGGVARPARSSGVGPGPPHSGHGGGAPPLPGAAAEHSPHCGNAGTEIDGQPIDEGGKVVCSFTAALRDPRVFDDPDVFDITREQPRTQLAFGFGEHYCLGANLARLQLQVILREIYSRIPDIHPSGEVVHQPTALFAGLLRMPVAFTPEELITGPADHRAEG